MAYNPNQPSAPPMYATDPYGKPGYAIAQPDASNPVIQGYAVASPVSVMQPGYPVGGVMPYSPLANPVFAQVKAIELPQQLQGSAVSPELWSIINSSDVFTIRQHVKLLPKQCCKCPPVTQENTYSVYAGNSVGEVEVLRVDEVSDDWNRCCCKPYHPLKLEVRQHIPLPGDFGFNDFNHLTADVQADFARYAGDPRGHSMAMREFYQRNPVLFSIVRNDGQRCCCKMPCKWLSTFVCFSCCQDGVHLYAGPIPNDPKEAGRPYTEGAAASLIGSATQPIFGGCCIPFIELRDGPDDTAPFGKVAGPCFFGGWSEMCFSFNFPVSFFNSDRSSGDIATIIKKRPVSATNMAVQLCTDFDVFGIKFNEQNLGKVTAEQKLTVLATQMLLDYMLFDGNTEKCKDTPEAVYCYCCYFSLLGAILPCYVAIPKKR
jgi:hypothetical protein